MISYEESSYGVVTVDGVEYVLTDQSDLSNRVMDHPDLVEFSARAHLKGDEDKECVVYWVFDKTKYDWDNIGLDELDWDQDPDRVEEIY